MIINFCHWKHSFLRCQDSRKIIRISAGKQSLAEHKNMPASEVDDKRTFLGQDLGTAKRMSTDILICHWHIDGTFTTELASHGSH